MNSTTTLWSRPGLRLAGVGHHLAFDPGIGPDRYARALEQLIETGCTTAFASFTFDPDEPGSIVIVPEAVASEAPVDPDRDPALPDGVLIDDTADLWRATVEKAIGAIDSGELQKVVLSRRVQAEMSQAIDPYAIARKLERRRTRSHVFLVGAMVGASPELLLRFAGGEVTSMPLAGSADGRAQLLESPKVAMEHRLAADSVAEALARSQVVFDRSLPEAVDFEDIRHLATHFSGIAPTGATFGDVLAELHPTAAVAGTPRHEAMETIRDLESDSRGRYSGPVGWFDRLGNGEFAIALRCGLVNANVVDLRSGAGIVSGSDPDAELEETNWKLAPMLDALGLSIKVR